MNFETLRDNVLSILTAAAAGKYIIGGGQVQTKGAGENILIPRVTFYYQRSTYPPSSNAPTGELIHEAQYRFDITVYVQHEADLSVLNDPSATKAAKAAALAELNNPDLQFEADKLMDSTWATVLAAVLNPANYDFGFTKGVISNRWISDFQKDDPASMGEFMVLSGSAPMTVRIKEDIAGEAGTAGVAYDNTVNIEGDQGDNLGASGSLGG